VLSATRAGAMTGHFIVDGGARTSCQAAARTALRNCRGRVIGAK